MSIHQAHATLHSHAMHGIRPHHRPPCPQCGEPLHRVHRHPLDRLLSLFVPLRRYTCYARDCQWTGVLRHRSAPR